MDLGKTLSASSAEPVAREERPKRMPSSAAFSSRLSNIPCPSVGQQKNGRLASWPKFLVDTYKVSGEFPARSRPSVLDHRSASLSSCWGGGGRRSAPRRNSGCGLLGATITALPGTHAGARGASHSKKKLAELASLALPRKN